jgi:ribonuclease VapC
MIVVDTSALVAVVFGEPERGAFVRRMEQAERVLVSTVSLVETRMVVSGRRGQRGVVLLDDLFRLPMIEIAAVGISYALAKTRGLPLLFKGDDFARTDVQPALMAAGVEAGGLREAGLQRSHT